MESNQQSVTTEMTFNVVKFVRDAQNLDPKPWLIVGKGPSSDFISRVYPADYHVFTLNHACKIIQPTIAHFVDIEAFMACLEHLCVTKVPYCLPWYPHVESKPTPVTLNTLGDAARMYNGKPLGPLLSYNATTAGKLKPHPSLPAIRLRFFSAVAAFNILATAGIKRITSIGVDGGRGYAEAFDTKDCLANGRDSFDAQTPEIQKTVSVNGIQWVKLNWEERNAPQD